MHHEASPTDIHWYWVLYNIPAGVNSLSRNVSGIGILGTNSVNDQTRYSPPCSQGPGIKAYTYTVYALSQNPSFSVPPDQVTCEALLNAISGITISRWQSERSCRGNCIFRMGRQELKRTGRICISAAGLGNANPQPADKIWC
jgi:hypothetical protein